MTEKLRTTASPRWGTALLIAAAPVLVAGSLAWVFPREAAAFAGPRTLPILSLVSLLVALGLAIEWRVLGGLLLVLAITLVIGWNPSSSTSTTHFAGACLGLLAMLTIGRMADTPGRLKLAMMAFLGAGTAVLLLGLAGTSAATRTSQVVTLPSKLPTLQLGLVGLEASGSTNPNALAAAALLVAPLGIFALLLRTGEKTDWLGLLPIALASVVTAAMTLAFCRSRSAWIAVWLILVGLLVGGMRSWLSRVVVCVLVVAPLVVATSSVMVLSQEEFQKAAGNWWSSTRSRVPIMTQGLERLKEAPWFGIGLNEFRATYNTEAGDVAHAHNIFLQTALDVGAVGSAAYWGVLTFLLVLAAQAARGLSKGSRSAAIGSAVSIMAVTLFGLLDAVPIGSKIGMFQWMAGGLILAARRTQFVATP
jgi:O-antigen ligase